jgi:hypothetical protein
MTFEDVCAMALAWPGVERSTSYRTPALKVKGKLLVRLREDGETLVIPGVGFDEREMLIETQPEIFFFTDHYRDWPIVLARLPRAEPAAIEGLLRRHWATLVPKRLAGGESSRG